MLISGTGTCTGTEDGKAWRIEAYFVNAYMVSEYITFCLTLLPEHSDSAANIAWISSVTYIITYTLIFYRKERLKKKNVAKKTKKVRTTEQRNIKCTLLCNKNDVPSTKHPFSRSFTIFHSSKEKRVSGSWNISFLNCECTHSSKVILGNMCEFAVFFSISISLHKICLDRVWVCLCL